jgi:Domain of Unknown Function with PDB structure (DUF3857)
VTLCTRITKFLAVLCLLQAGFWSAAAQEPAAKPPEKPVEKQKPAEKPALPFQIQLLETHVRFEANGDSRKVVHTVVKLNNILGAREFARLAFDYNRAFQQLEIPQVRITHANGGTSEVLPSAISDAANPAVEKFPAYQDVRVKSVRILGLQEGDTVDYRVITTTAHHPLAPDFWLEHSFDRSGQVLKEQYELILPASRPVQIAIAASAPPTKKEQSGEGDSASVRYWWELSATDSKDNGAKSEKAEPEVVLTSFASWKQLADRIAGRIIPGEETVREQSAKAKEIAQGKTKPDQWINAFYDFVSQKIVTVDLALGATGFKTRPVAEILSSGYATPEDKFMLFASLNNNYCGPAKAGLTNSTRPLEQRELPRPSVFDHLLTMSGYPSINVWMDLNLEVAPYLMIPSQFRGKRALLVGPAVAVSSLWPIVVETAPFAAFQKVAVDAKLAESGSLTARVNYTIRGYNELLLRMAFHQTPKEKWKDVASLLSISDGFRGQVINVKASDPMATKEPFTIEYELSQPKFVDWSKKPVRIPALLPQIGLPEPPTKLTEDGKPSNIELGTPLNVETQLMLHLPPGTKVQTPAGTSVTRDYATYTSKYSATADVLTASRQIKFLLSEVSAERAMDYNAFLHAIQSDQAQQIVLVPAAGSENDPKH